MVWRRILKLNQVFSVTKKEGNLWKISKQTALNQTRTIGNWSARNGICIEKANCSVCKTASGFVSKTNPKYSHCKKRRTHQISWNEWQIVFSLFKSCKRKHAKMRCHFTTIIQFIHDQSAIDANFHHLSQLQSMSAVCCGLHFDSQCE